MIANQLLPSALILSTVLILIGGPAVGSSHPNTRSQMEPCNLVDEALAKVPHGNGDNTVTDNELGPEGWRYNSRGRSFVTFLHTLDPSGAAYSVFAGRSNVGVNSGIVNDYPLALDLPQSTLSGPIIFSGRRGEIVLTGDPFNEPPQFAMPGKGAGEVRISLHDPDRDGIYVGCAQSQLLENFGLPSPQEGGLVQREFFKVYAETDEDGVVTFFEWTEVSTFKNSTSQNQAFLKRQPRQP